MIKLRNGIIFGMALFLAILLAMFIHQAFGRPASTCATVVLGIVVGWATFAVMEGRGEGE